MSSNDGRPAGNGTAATNINTGNAMMHAESVALADLDAQWTAAMAKLANEDDSFAVLLFASARRRRRASARRATAPTRTNLLPTPPRTPARRTVQQMRGEDPDGYADYLDRAWMRITGELWIAECRRNARARRYRSADAGGTPTRRAVLRSITTPRRVLAIGGVSA